MVPTERNANNRSRSRESRHPDKISKILRSGHSTPGSKRCRENSSPNRPIFLTTFPAETVIYLPSQFSATSTIFTKKRRIIRRELLPQTPARVCRSYVGLTDEVLHDDLALTFVAVADSHEDVADAEETLRVEESLLVINGKVWRDRLRLRCFLRAVGWTKHGFLAAGDNARMV